MKSREEKSHDHLGRWLPEKSIFRENLRSFVYATLVTVIMLVETCLPPLLKRGTAWYSFYIGAYLKYFIRASIVLFFVLVLEKKSLTSLGFRNFRKDNRIFWRELIFTLLLCAIFLSGVKFAPAQSFYAGLSEFRLWFQAAYVLTAVSLVEEMVFRGFIFSRLSFSIGKLLALLSSSAFMALWHLPYYLRGAARQGTFPFHLLIVAFIISLVNCLILIVTEKTIGRWNIYPAIFLHWLGDVGFYLINKIL
jgi:membrane protease YdiL (CAAX protease family)